MAFVPLYCESHYSPAGVANCAELARRAHALGYTALGLCDDGTIAGFQDFTEACQAHGIRPIYGCRIWMEGFIHTDRRFPLDFHIETDQGYRNLVRLLTQFHELKDRQAILPTRLSLKGRTGGLLVTLPPDGELAELVRSFNREGTERYLDMAMDYLGADVALGLDIDPQDFTTAYAQESGQWDAPQPGGRVAAARIVEVPGGGYPSLMEFGEAGEAWAEPPAAMAETEPARTAVALERPAPREIWTLMRDLAEFVRLPALPAPRVRFAEPGDAPAYVFLQNPHGAPGRGWDGAAHCDDRLPAMLPEDAILTRFQADEAFVARASEMARRLTWKPGLNRRVIPVQDFERGFDPNSFLFDLVIRGAASRYGEITEEVKQRINREFEEVKTRNLAPFLLLYRQITQFLDENGIARGVGRGAAVASAISYCLGITRIDPIQYRLAPQPLASDGETFPPIRIEIPSGAMGKAIAWLRSTFGEHHLAQIGRRVEIRREQMIEALAAWAGMNEEEKTQALAERKRRKTLGAAHRLDDLAEARHWRRWRDPAFINDIAEKLTPRPRAVSPAPGRWTLSAETLDYIAPTLRSAAGERVTDIGEEALDQLGAPRIEFAPHHLVNLLDRARAGVAQIAPGVNLREIPMDDRATFDLIGRGDTLGIPPLSGVTVRCLLAKSKPTTILQILKVKTDANRGRAAEKTRQLVDDLPEVLLAYQLAYFKANHPVAFFASAFSSAAENGEDLTALLRAARRRGIEILPPDINLSGATCQPYGDKIRLGLLMVRRLGEKALEEIMGVRLGGRFNSLRELCVGVSPKALNLRLIHGLIASGACDGFGQSRAYLSSLVSRVSRRARNDETEDGARQISLFDITQFEEEEEREAEGEAAQNGEWDPVTVARRERETLGFSLSRDPFEDFPRALAAIRPLGPGQLTPRLNGKRVWVAGLITDVDEEGPIVGGDGGRLVDLEGAAIRLAGPLARLSAHALKPGVAALGRGVVNARDGYLCVEAEGFWRLEDLEEQGHRVAIVRLDLTGENRATLKHLIELARAFPGGARFDLVHYPRRKGFTFGILSRLRVCFCTPFYQGLCTILTPDRIQLLDESKQFLVFARTRNGAGSEQTQN